jgi:hypothetical protein
LRGGCSEVQALTYLPFGKDVDVRQHAPRLPSACFSASTISVNTLASMTTGRLFAGKSRASLLATSTFAGDVARELRAVESGVRSGASCELDA